MNVLEKKEANLPEVIPVGARILCRYFSFQVDHKRIRSILGELQRLLILSIIRIILPSLVLIFLLLKVQGFEGTDGEKEHCEVEEVQRLLPHRVLHVLVVNGREVQRFGEDRVFTDAWDAEAVDDDELEGVDGQHN